MSSSTTQGPDSNGHIPIPSPPGLPILGNIADVESEVPLNSFMQILNTYGEIVRVNLNGSRIFIGSVELMNELCDETRFCKAISGGLNQVRNGIHDGLFTAHHGEKNWGVAHRILMPAFGPVYIRGMFDEMHDIASQLVLKFARHGPTYKIPVTDDFTRLTLDTLALCAMGYRFNSYYTEGMHPFLSSMADFLIESGRRANRPGVANMLMRSARQKYDADIKLLQDTAQEVLRNRKAHPQEEKKDLLNAMIYGRDPQTGEGLSDESITNNMITFLIAGHETTSGMLSFVFHNLLRSPVAYRKAQQEVDDVCGKGNIKVDHLSKLKYIAAVLRESLRLNPTASAWAVKAKPDTKEDPVLAGKYVVGKDEAIIMMLSKIHRDPKVYGEDAEEFKPERMLDEKFEKLPPNAWKPFGNGMRGCIGRPFAWQEALLVVALLLQNFNFQLDDPNYVLHLKQTLTIKPKDFYMRATLRDGIDATELEKRLGGSGSSAGAETQKVKLPKKGDSGKPKKPMSIFYGSNTGTCEALAQRLATEATGHGFNAEIETLDSATQNIPKDRSVVVITASYEGQPADNATHFVEWLKSISGNELEGTKFAVFACGHHDWQATFLKVPTVIDNLMSERGGTRLVTKGAADAAEGDMFSAFDDWQDGNLWPTLEKEYDAAGGEGLEPTVEVEVSTQTRPSNLKQDLRNGLVVDTKILTAPGEPQKGHVEIQLPSEYTYRSGDYLAVLPINPRENVRRVMKHFRLPWDSSLHITANGPTVLPTNVEISAYDILASYVELTQPATKKNIKTLATHTNDESTKTKLEGVANNATLYSTEIIKKRVSPLDLLETYSSIKLPFGEFLAMLPPMRVRQYSISSSPLCNPSNCTITFSLLSQTALSGHGVHLGAASSYLSRLEPGDHLQCAIRPSPAAFHLPLEVDQTPILGIAAGTGLAPFRGFVQERAAQIAAGRKLAPALLFIGCRDPEKDMLYQEEFERWQEMGAVDVRYAFSRATEKSDGCKYVQHRLYNDKKDAVELWEKGAKVFVCGSRDVGEAVGEVVKKIFMERAEELGKIQNEESAEKWFSSIRNERFATDVFD